MSLRGGSVLTMCPEQRYLSENAINTNYRLSPIVSKAFEIEYGVIRTLLCHKPKHK